MARVEPFAVHNRSRWSLRPDTIGRARASRVASGLVFLTAYEQKSPLERVRMIGARSNNITKPTSSPFGNNLLHAAYAGGDALYWTSYADLDLTGQVTLLTRMAVSSYYYPTIFSKYASTSGSAPGGTYNIPFQFTCNNYYTYGEPRFRPAVYRANASTYRSSDDLPSTYQPPNVQFVNVGIFCDENMQTAPHIWFDGTYVQMSAPSGTGTGRPTDNTGNIVLSIGNDHGQHQSDWLAVFNRRLSVHEARDIFNAPWGELFDAPETERSMYFFSPSTSSPAAASPALNLLLGVGD